MNKRLHEEFFKDFEDADPKVIKGREKYLNYIHGVMYDDTQETEDRKLLAIGRTAGQVPETLIFPSIIGIDKEAVRLGQKLAYCVRIHKKDGDVQGIIQIEYAINKDKQNDTNNKDQKQGGK